MVGKMTAPTQAQIEAAAKALEYYVGYNSGELARAALTAAAEAGEKDWVRELDRKGAELAAAHIQDTIERCAQVAERMAGRIEALPHQDNASRLATTILREAAAAIRALDQINVR